ncbi:MAG: SMC-Scp complex subunit ScpB [Caldilineaceae bacterium SB0666_bin_21]|nr:SMC-Scp complex subunit ScpB [Caldilineaceae bacterium SB0666_bin_21]
MSDMRPQPSLAALLESLLFVAPEPVTVQALARVVDRPAPVVRFALEELEETLEQNQRGLRLLTLGQKVALVTMPEAGDAIDRFVALARRSRLSQPATETVAIIAYHQPVTRGQIEAIRGVDSAHVLRTLLARELIEVRGRKETVGNPLLYGVTEQFLLYFGMTSLEELPELDPEAASRIEDAAAEADDADLTGDDIESVAEPDLQPDAASVVS